mmetsp:Transcript_3621/g.5376  ORF Transcript_3621/g.5376 Transcript_3621/m.5376 type:complete len:625 (+) Transcript_3621:97-1971(+)
MRRSHRSPHRHNRSPRRHNRSYSGSPGRYIYSSGDESDSNSDYEVRFARRVVRTPKSPERRSRKDPKKVKQRCKITRALLIGVDYADETETGTKDVSLMAATLSDLGFKADQGENCITLTSDSETGPTRRNILRALKWFTKDVQPGDVLWFYFSGQTHIEKKPELEEYLEPMDYNTAGCISGATIRSYLVDCLPGGSTMYATMDCSHGGGIMGLRYLYNSDDLKLETAVDLPRSDASVVLLSSVVPPPKREEPDRCLTKHLSRMIGQGLSWQSLFNGLNKSMPDNETMFPQLESGRRLQPESTAFSDAFPSQRNREKHAVDEEPESADSPRFSKLDDKRYEVEWKDGKVLFDDKRDAIALYRRVCKRAAAAKEAKKEEEEEDPPLKGSAPELGAETDTLLTGQELELFEAINKARAFPEYYADLLSGKRRYFDGKIYKEPGQAPAKTQEGVKALDEAINFLDNLKPLGPLAARRQMCIPSLFYLEDLAEIRDTPKDEVEIRMEKYGSWGGDDKLGSNWHFGRRQGGGDAESAVCAFIVGDGDDSRQQRLNLFSDKFTNVGLAVHPHPKEVQSSLVVFATDFRSHPVSRPQRTYSPRSPRHSPRRFSPRTWRRAQSPVEYRRFIW